MRRTGRVIGAAVVAAIVTVLGGGVASAEVLGPEELAIEMRANEALRRHVRDRGFPDLAQRWDLDASWPWQSYIVRLFYLEPRTEIAFSRAFVLDRPDMGLMRYKRPISDEVAAELRRYLAGAPGSAAYDVALREGPPTGEPASRAETAARRAEVAAEMTELGAAAAEDAAKRLESVATEVESSFRKQLQK